jgi:hypothetical protein
MRQFLARAVATIMASAMTRHSCSATSAAAKARLSSRGITVEFFIYPAASNAFSSSVSLLRTFLIDLAKDNRRHQNMVIVDKILLVLVGQRASVNHSNHPHESTMTTIAEYKNVAGRAGRLGFNETGKASPAKQLPYAPGSGCPPFDSAGIGIKNSRSNPPSPRWHRTTNTMLYTSKAPDMAITLTRTW